MIKCPKLFEIYRGAGKIDLLWILGYTVKIVFSLGGETLNDKNKLPVLGKHFKLLEH